MPLDKRVEQISIFDSIHRSDGSSIVDLPAILGTIFMLLGVIYGFVLHLGPIIWGIIGLAACAVLGLVLKLLGIKRKPAAKRKQQTEVFLMIHCKEELSERIKDILWEHNAFGIGVQLINLKKDNAGVLHPKS